MMTYPSVAACLEIVGPKKVVTSLAHGVLPLVDDCHLFASGKVDGYQHAGFICFLSRMEPLNSKRHHSLSDGILQQ